MELQVHMYRLNMREIMTTARRDEQRRATRKAGSVPV